MAYLFDLFENQFKKSGSLSSDKTKMEAEVSYLIDLLQEQAAKVPGSSVVDPNKEKLVKSLEYLNTLVKKAEQQVKDTAQPK